MNKPKPVTKPPYPIYCSSTAQLHYLWTGEFQGKGLCFEINDFDPVYISTAPLCPMVAVGPYGREEADAPRGIIMFASPRDITKLDQVPESRLPFHLRRVFH